jgi:hypothetical protein
VTEKYLKGAHRKVPLVAVGELEERKVVEKKVVAKRVK